MIDAPPLPFTVRPLGEGPALLARMMGYAESPGRRRGALPWTLTCERESLLLTLDQLREELVSDRANRDRVVACGAVIENLRLAAHSLGVELEMNPWPDGPASGAVARLSVGAHVASRREEQALLDVLVRPPHAHGSDAGGVASPALLAVLRHAARTEGGWLDVVADDPRRMLFADLESEATIIADAERGARRILASAERAVDGTAHLVRGGGPSLGELLAPLGANVRPTTTWPEGGGGAARAYALDAPILAVLGAQDDAPNGWLRAGMALQRVLLHASVQGLRASFLNAPLDHPLLRDAVRALLFAGGAPQAIVRFDFEASVVR